MKLHRQITNESSNWSGRNWNVHILKIKTTKGKENCQWNENISAIFVINKQRKHSRSFLLTGCCPWPLVGKVFFKISENEWRRLWTWYVYPVGFAAIQLYRGSFPKAGLFSLSFHHSKGNWWHQSSTAVNINKFSCCDSSRFKHLQGPSDLNSQAVLFPVWTFAASLNASSRSLTGQ